MGDRGCSGGVDSAAAEAEQKLHEAENSENKTEAEIEVLKKDAESKREVSSQVRQRKRSKGQRRCCVGGRAIEQEAEENKMKNWRPRKLKLKKLPGWDARKADKLEKEAKAMELEIKREQQQLVEELTRRPKLEAKREIESSQN